MRAVRVAVRWERPPVHLCSASVVVSRLITSVSIDRCGLKERGSKRRLRQNPFSAEVRSAPK